MMFPNEVACGEQSAAPGRSPCLALVTITANGHEAVRRSPISRRGPASGARRQRRPSHRPHASLPGQRPPHFGRECSIELLHRAPSALTRTTRIPSSIYVPRSRRDCQGRNYGCPGQGKGRSPALSGLARSAEGGSAGPGGPAGRTSRVPPTRHFACPGHPKNQVPTQTKDLRLDIRHRAAPTRVLGEVCGLTSARRRLAAP